MFFGCPIVAYDVVYNRETTQNKAYYFSNTEMLISIICRSDLEGTAMKRIAEEEYTWQYISRQYYSQYMNPIKIVNIMRRYYVKIFS